jgi:hypothetical protein
MVGDIDELVSGMAVLQNDAAPRVGLWGLPAREVDMRNEHANPHAGARGCATYRIRHTCNAR